MNGSLYPDPPHLDLACIGAPDGSRDLILRVCEALPGAGAVLASELEVAESVSVAHFVGTSDLVTSLVDLRHNDRSLENIRSLSESYALVKIGYMHPLLGTLVVQYGLTEEPATLDEHPVVVTMSADAAHGSGLARDASQKMFSSMCAIEKVLYGSMLTERQLPNVESLQQGARLPANLFVATKLIQNNSHLSGALDSHYAAGLVANWHRGRFYQPRKSTTQDVTSSDMGAGKLLGAAARREGNRYRAQGS